MATQTPTQTAQNQALYREALQLARLAACVLLAVLLAKSFVFETSPVHGPSMEPTLNPDERILVYKLPAVLHELPLLHWIDPAPTGGLVVFESRDEAGKRYVKRVIAKGPARSQANVVRAEARAEAASAASVLVRYEHGAVYINNRRVDETYLQPEERQSPDTNTETLGEGQYYVLGDHRSVSKDSRRIGPVDESQIVGRAIWRVWPLSKFGPL